MKSKFSRFTSYTIGTLAITAAITFGNSAWAEPSHRDDSVPVLTADDTIADQPIEFRTLVPDRPVTLPKKNGNGVTVEKFGVRITNNSSSEKVFSSNFIEPSFVDKNAKIISLMGCGYGRIPMLGKENFTLLKPGESIEFLYPTYFIWHHGDMMFEYDIPDGGSCVIRGLKAGRYSVSIAYDVERYTDMLNNTALWHEWNIDPKSVWKEKAGIKRIPEKLELLESR